MQRRQRSAYGRRPSVPAAHVETQPKWVESIEALLRGLGDRLVELWAHTINFLSIVLWVGGLYTNVVASIVALISLACGYWILGGLILLVQGVLLSIPLGATPAWGRRLLRFSIRRGIDFFPMRLIMEDGGKGILPGRAYVIGFEPHSALPLAMAGVFSDYSEMLPPALAGIKTLASSALFWVPALRHLWFWLGMRPVSKAVIKQLLQAGTSIALCPGGVAECLHMRHGEEVAFLSSRTGFVRIAIQNGADLIPAFAFGQTQSYSWAKPGPPIFSEAAVASFARMIGFLPLFMAGQRLFGVIPTPLPHAVPMTVILGRPIQLPHMPEPPAELVHQFLKQFIDDLTALVDKHAADAGYPDMPFTVY